MPTYDSRPYDGELSIQEHLATIEEWARDVDDRLIAQALSAERKHDALVGRLDKVHKDVYALGDALRRAILEHNAAHEEQHRMIVSALARMSSADKAHDEAIAKHAQQMLAVHNKLKLRDAATYAVSTGIAVGLIEAARQLMPLLRLMFLHKVKMQQISSWIDANPQVTYALWMLATAILTAIFRKRDPEAEAKFRESWPRLYGLREIVRALGLDSPKLLSAIVALFGPRKARADIEIVVDDQGGANER